MGEGCKAFLEVLVLPALREDRSRCYGARALSETPASKVTADALFASFFLPLYPEAAARDLAKARSTDANPAKNPSLYAHLGEAAERFAVMFPRLVGEEVDLDFTDASVHRLAALLTAERRDAWAAQGTPGTPENALFNVVVHGAAYLGACIVKNHGGAWSLRNPMWESVVTLTSRAGTGDLPLFHWWLKSLADENLAHASGSLADRYRTHVEVPRARPEDLPPIFEGERRLPRLTKVRYDVLYKYIKAHLPELRDLGEHFPSPERFEEYELKWLEPLALGENRILLLSGLGRGGLHLFFLTKTGFEKALFFPADSFPDPIVRARGDKLEVHLSLEKKQVVHEMLYWGM